MSFPIDRNYSVPYQSSTEGILSSRFPNLHGNEAVHFDYFYTGGVFNNAYGGLQTKNGTAYVGIFDIGITADTEKLGLWKNGTFYTHALFSHGRNPSRYVGDYQGFAVFAYETPAQVSEYWYEHRFFDEAFAVRGGKLDAGVDFFYLESTADFINSSGTCVPTTGIPTAPDNAWGVLFDLDLTKNFCVKFGVFDADANANKFWMSESGNVYTAYQIEYHYSLFKYLPGFSYLGTWYNDSENTGYAGNTHFGNSGFSAGFEQMLYRKNYCDRDDLRGLTVFTHFSRTSTDRENDLAQFWSLGLQWLGLFENRPDDVLGFGVFCSRFDKDFRINDALFYASETAYELFYKVNVTENLAVQPVFQYIVHPGGVYRNSIAPGFVFQMTF
jgi:porin